MLVMLNIPEEYRGWEPDPPPGSDEAIVQGCTCPSKQPRDKLKIVVEHACPLHAIELVKPN